MKSKHLLSVTLAVFIVVFAAAEYTISTNQRGTPAQIPATGEINTTPTPVSGTAPASQTSSKSTQTSGYTLAQVARHASASSCWAAINGKVYDLTNWIDQHPGGPDRILSICGTDGSAAFNAQHGGQTQPARELTQFYIGTLAR